MPRPALRSRSFRRVKKRKPGGKGVVHYKKRKPRASRCGRCKKPLYGVPRERPYKMKKLPKTKKRPTRPYGGNLCSSCMRLVVKERFIK